MIESIKKEGGPEKMDRERLEKIWEAACNQSKENKEALEKADKEEALEILNSALARMHDFEATADADKESLLTINPEIAKKIGTIFAFSGPGTYDRGLKKPDPEKGYKGDNPKLMKWFLEEGNRRRIMHAVLLFRRIAEARSGRPAPGNLLNDSPLDHQHAEEARAFYREFGPTFGFGGYRQENDEARKVMERLSTVIPQENVVIFEPAPGEKEWETTTDQVKNFKVLDKDRDMDVAYVSDDIHLNRIVQIASKFHENLPAEKPVHLFPSVTPQDGRKEFEDMELTGLLVYIYKAQVAEKEPYPYTLER